MGDDRSHMWNADKMSTRINNALVKACSLKHSKGNQCNICRYCEFVPCTSFTSITSENGPHSRVQIRKPTAKNAVGPGTQVEMVSLRNRHLHQVSK